MKTANVVLSLLLITFSNLLQAEAEQQSIQTISAGYAIDPNVTDSRAGGVDLKLDVYTQRAALNSSGQASTELLPAVVF